MDSSNPKSILAWIRKNAVAFSVLLGLALIGMFALAQSCVAIFAIARFGASFSEIANADLPSLIAASQLFEQNQSLVAIAPQLAGTRSQTRRQAVADEINEQLAALAGAIDRIDPAAIDHNRLQAVRSELTALATSLNGLNAFVKQRIDADDAHESVMSRLPESASRVRK